MPDDAMIVWTIPVSKQTDAHVREFLAGQGVADEEMAKFIEDAVKWRVFDKTIAEARTGFADLQPHEVEALVDEAVAFVRRRDVEHSVQAT